MLNLNLNQFRVITAIKQTDTKVFTHTSEADAN